MLGKRPEDRAEAGDLVRAALAARERSRGAFLAVLNRAPAGAGEEAARAVREAGIPCVLLPEVPCPEGARFFPAGGLGRIFEAFTGGSAAGKEKA